MSAAKMARGEGFSVPRTPVSPEAMAAFQAAETAPRAFSAALVGAVEAPATTHATAEPLHARLSVEVSAETLRNLKMRAIERRQTIREYVIALLAKDGL